MKKDLISGKDGDTAYKEKRKDTRVHFRTQVVLVVEEDDFLEITTTGDISRTGLFVKTDQTLSLGTNCSIELLFKGVSSKTSLYLKGSVVRYGKGGLGIKFDNVEVDSFFHLNNFLKHTVLDPKTIQKELFPVD